MPTRDGRMKAREWLFYTEDLALAALHESVPRPQRKVMWTILQFYWDQPLVHFELQPQPSRSLIEVGLHFEGPLEQNEYWAGRVAQHQDEIRAALGDEWELEEWTKSWRRIHRPYHFEQLTAPLGREIAAEWAKAINLMWPFAQTREAFAAPHHAGDELAVALR
ncbi:MAG: hypothetical protein AB7J35_10905 [Dehalococcoidia bacterium]